MVVALLAGIAVVCALAAGASVIVARWRIGSSYEECALLAEILISNTDGRESLHWEKMTERYWEAARRFRWPLRTRMPK